MSRGFSVPTLHQQDGALSVQAFAEREGLTHGQAMRCIRGGKVLGARKDARSKHWWIYPPAKLLAEPRKRAGAVSGAEPDTLRAAPPSGAGVMAAVSCSHVDAHPSQNVARASVPPAKPLLTLDGATLPPCRAARTKEHGTAARCGRPAVYAEARNVCQTLHEAAARQFREGLHYLRLDAHEFAQLYTALSNDRRRVRKLIGKKLLPVGLLRASDTVWQKMQAMCHEGRLL